MLHEDFICMPIIYLGHLNGTNSPYTIVISRVVGMYETLNPVYIVKDVETIKNITIKDFDHFVDRRSFASELDPSFGRSLINLKGQ